MVWKWNIILTRHGMRNSQRPISFHFVSTALKKCQHMHNLRIFESFNRIKIESKSWLKKVVKYLKILKSIVSLHCKALSSTILTIMCYRIHDYKIN